MRAEQVIGDDHTEYGVTEELQALIRLETTAFVGIGAVRQSKREQLGVDLNAESGEQRGQI
jgi:hypothetical protein